MYQLGMIGLGIMGLPMAVNLIKHSGHPVMGFDVVPAQTRKLEEAGGQIAQSIEALAAACDVVFMSLPSNQLVFSTVQTVIEHAATGTVIVDLSSTAPTVVRELDAPVREKGMWLLDSPVSGGETGAIAAKLVLMCGGDEAAFKRVEPLLCCIGSKVTHMGPIGCGSIAKLANNMIVGVNILAVGEALAYAKKAGLDPAVLFQAIEAGYAGSVVLSEKAPKILSRDFSASARIAIHQKDLQNAVDLAEQMGVDIPLSAIALDYMNRIREQGGADEDHCACVKIFEQNMGVTIES